MVLLPLLVPDSSILTVRTALGVARDTLNGAVTCDPEVSRDWLEIKREDIF